VPDPQEIYARLREAYPAIGILKRPSSRPFAGVTLHDPVGNFFHLSYERLDRRMDVYADAALQGASHRRRIHHFQLRVMDAPAIARFYRDVFELTELPQDAGDPSHYLTDGVVTMIITPWRIEDFGVSNAEAPAMDHLGFAVESIDQFAADLERLANRNYALAPKRPRAGESECRMELLATCRYGGFQFGDPDGILLEVVQD